ncbi:MAG: zinc dependent phospholipase C family protein [Gammaproteobacteria bacterium]|nr:zinc dependent phospholipase C family protein [Gammaproteobacteria bacterium]MBU1969461.1 zinc dependent phospholipase C family protein [Gammaproteobacteria bacterium]
MNHRVVIMASHGAAKLRGMEKALRHWRWLFPLLLFSGDALAWGLYTHVYFAQLLLWAVPLTDPRFRKAVIAYPKLVLAGACLPDLALLSERPWGEPFSTTHQWQRARKLLDDARSDEEYALSLGFVSHLLVDVIAHNHFVPAHEKMWGNVPVLTHAACEWAMDMHIRKQLFAQPGELMDAHRKELADYVAQHFDCPQPIAKRGVGMLAGAENLLRFSCLSELSYRVAGALDGHMQRRFNYYLSETSARLVHIDRILSGEEPVWDANPDADDPQVRRRIELVTPLQLRHRIPLPQDVFSIQSVVARR